MEQDTPRIVLHRSCTPEDRKQTLKEMASSKLIPKTFLKHDFNCVKILHKPHMFKTSNPVINLDNDDWILPEDTVLDQFGLVNETELTFFNRADYEQYKLNPVHKTT
eukprot:scpid8217/ scgid2580/ UPF0538 protein C2orf76 homolog